MQSSKLEFIKKYNDLVTSATSSAKEFPNLLCEFILSEFEVQTVALFKVSEDNKLLLLGKTGNIKKNFNDVSGVECANCSNHDHNITDVSFKVQTDCTIQISDFAIYEGCLDFNLSEADQLIIKISKKAPFTIVDKDQFEAFGRLLINILRNWLGFNKFEQQNLSDVVVNIAHELRTPTNSIMGFASLLNEDNLTNSQAEYVTTLKENAFNLLSLINDLIDLAKIEKGIYKENLNSFSIKNLVDEVIKVFNDKIEKGKVDFVVNIGKEIPDNIKIDNQKLKLILLNIITFSIRCMDKGKIYIQASLSNNKLNFKISDTSQGIPNSKLKTLFSPFTIFDLTNNNVGNITGLSLTLAKKYIEILKGKIEINSSIGKGNNFNFYINAEALPNVEVPLSELPKPTAGKNKVLVIEDDYATSKLLSNYLYKWGYEPIIVNTADQALKMIDKEVYLAILMDIVLPDVNGLELLKRIKDHKNTRNTPVIVCSVEAEQQKAFLMGAVEYFVKPVNYKNLVEVLTSYKLKKDSNILIVDDDVPTLNLIKSAVEQAGFNTTAEAHSSQVITLIEDKHIDLAIIDLDMPELSGFDLIKLIKSNPKFTKLPIIIYTGKENFNDDLKKIDGLFEDLLSKRSTNIEDLADTISQMINRDDIPVKQEELINKNDVVKILLVEDYKHSQIIVTRLLKKNNFDSIVVVENGAEAVDAVQKQKFNLILMDMQMPVMNGFEATERIRKMPEYKETPIIALTAFAMKGDREKCLEAGATDYIPKPIDSQEFIEKVRYYTESKVTA